MHLWIMESLRFIVRIVIDEILDLPSLTTLFVGINGEYDMNEDRRGNCFYFVPSLSLKSIILSG